MHQLKSKLHETDEGSSSGFLISFFLQGSAVGGGMFSVGFWSRGSPSHASDWEIDVVRHSKWILEASRIVQSPALTTYPTLKMSAT